MLHRVTDKDARVGSRQRGPGKRLIAQKSRRVVNADFVLEEIDYQFDRPEGEDALFSRGLVEFSVIGWTIDIRTSD